MENNFITTELQKFNLTDAAIAEIKQQYMPLVINGIEDKEGYKLVKEARILVKTKRVEVEKKRKELKEESLKFGRAVDTEAKRITALLLPIEAHLEYQQEAVEAERERIKQEAEQKRQAIIQGRIDALLQFSKQIDFVKISSLSEQQFEAELASAKFEHEVAQAEAAEAERVRLEEEARLEKIRQEEQERQRLADEIAREQKRKQAEQEAEALEAKRKAIEQAEIELAQKQAAIRAEEDKKELERKRQEEEKRQENLKPDKEKIKHFAMQLQELRFPAVESEEANFLLDKAAKFIDQAIDVLKKINN